MSSVTRLVPSLHWAEVKPGFRVRVHPDHPFGVLLWCERGGSIRRANFTKELIRQGYAMLAPGIKVFTYLSDPVQFLYVEYSEDGTYDES